MPQSNEAIAVVINLTAVSTSAGFTTAFAFGGTVPNSSVLNWSGNGYTVAIRPSFRCAEGAARTSRSTTSTIRSSSAT